MDTAVLQDLDARIRAQQANWLAQWFEVHAQPPDDKLFHYTDADGLLGIAKSRVFWATNIEYLNDSSELTYCIELIRKRLEQKKQAISQNAMLSILEILSEAESSFNPFRYLSIFVSCFCESGDLLSQWRGYGRAGGGYSICLQPRHADKLPADQPRIILRRVLYAREGQEALIDESIEQIVKFWSEILSKNCDAETTRAAKERILSFFRQEVGDYIWCFKNPAFSEEREWRFSYVTGEKDPNKRRVKFRSGRDSIIPFVELDLFHMQDAATSRVLQLTEVVCGPTLHPSLAVKSIKSMLESTGFKDVEVRASRVPLRG